VVVIIIVQPNEPKEIKDYLINENISIKEFQNLPFDYMMVVGEYRVAVERKEAVDFVNSIKDGRLHEQLYMMSTYSPISFLVVIGNVTTALMENKFSRQAYIGALISSTLKQSPDGTGGHISVINLDTTYDFMLFLKILHKQLEDGNLLRVPTITTSKKDIKHLSILTLSTFPSVGEAYAMKLIEKFGSIYSVVNASLTELSEVLGEKRAKKVYEYIRSDYHGSGH
jgi:ERCC4-type nuclease